jgi:uncharacterized surface protein with fasciclin (FAS1) repeats
VAGASAAGRSLQQAVTYNTFPGCTFLADSPVLTDPQFSTLVAGLDSAGLTPLLSDISTSIAGGTHSALTVFAPTNAAFDEYLSAFNVTATQLLASPALRDILLYHVVPQAYSTLSVFKGGDVLPTLLGGGNNLTITIDNGTYVLGDLSEAQISGPPTQACNLLIYPVDEVLLPAEEQPLIFAAVQQNAGNEVAESFVEAIAEGQPQVVNQIIYSVTAAPGGIPVTANILEAVYELLGNSCTNVTPLITAANAALAGNSAGGATSINSYLTQKFPAGVATCAPSSTSPAGK